MQFTDLVPRANVTLMRRGVPVLGEREARLLEAIARVHSIKDAAREAGISYRTAWGAIQLMERAFGRPVVESRAGGPGGGGTTLTDECQQLLRSYQEMRRHLEGDLARVWGSPGNGGLQASASG
ncbi:MAG TPA: LysR family transcriptional regulator [Gemmatimonadales bacterium]|nr:LysR family transcriptional regulator [Gemmatimonadales bacterium]